MNEQTTPLGPEVFLIAVILIAAIFYFTFRFIKRAKKVNKVVREHRQGVTSDDTA